MGIAQCECQRHMTRQPETEALAVTLKGGQAGVVESVKSASEIYAPVSGEVVEINTALSDNSGLINSDPMGAAWFFKVRLSAASELDSMKDEAAYTAYTQGL